MYNDDYSPRAMAVNLRTYSRERSDKSLETPQETTERSHWLHHKKLAEVNGKPISTDELDVLTDLGVKRQSWVAGRTRWLGGTPYAYSRACSQFNCSFLTVSTVYDVVDAAWLLLNGCGVGFKPVVGTLHGFHRPVKVEIVPSTKLGNEKGNPDNSWFLEADGTWNLFIGDSAQAWAKALGKLFVPPGDISKIRLIFVECRGPGERLSGYGWICNGYRPMAEAMSAIIGILNNKAGELLDEIDILDVVNHIGTILSSRRSAQIALMDSSNPRAGEFALAKRNYWETGNNQRRQSNNTLQFWNKPNKSTIIDLLHHAHECGGDPAIENAEAARNKAPWFVGSNPCHEILLADKGFCNLVTNCLPRFGRNFAALERAIHYIARANYRQSCVKLDDGILQPAWDQTNSALHLCGVSLTGIVQADWLTDYQIRKLRNVAVAGAYSQADEWGLPRPKAITTLKPEGTGSKAMGSPLIGEIAEGIHRPLGQWIYNWINFSKYDPLVPLLESAGYKVIDSPADTNNVLICFPVDYRGIKFDVVDGKPVNLENAISQLNRYLRWNTLWADHTVSCTVSYSPDEISAIADWLYDNWDRGFIAVSFLLRCDPTKTARDLGHPYLPQEVQTPEVWSGYQRSLRAVDWSKVSGYYDLDSGECLTGVCPTK